MNSTAALVEKMQAEGIPEEAVEAFINVYRNLLRGDPSTIPEADLLPVLPGSILRLEELHGFAEAGAEALAETAIVKLNGGLGSTMGLHGPKSLIRIKEELSFLDVTVRQVGHLNTHRGIATPLLLMNSFFTDDATRRAIAAMDAKLREYIECFSQNKYPKVQVATLDPVSVHDNTILEWNPAGHGDLFLSLRTSGLLQTLLDRGFRYLFVSNIDNLGAEIDLTVLGYMASEGLDFLMEVTDRTEMDRKGGHLARLRNGRLALRETGQCAPEDAASFRDISRHAFFNTNNIWISLDAIQMFLDEKRNLSMPPVISRKKLITGSTGGPEVLHFESALGSAISLFEKSAALRVPRSRFAPVKNCDDLLVVWSDYYRLMPDYRLCINPARHPAPLSLKLDPAFYSSIDLLDSRFPCGAPSLLDCISFTVHGDIRFGCNITVRGEASLTNNAPDQREIEDGATLSGDRIL